MQDLDVERRKRHKERQEAFGDCSFKFAGRTLRFLPNAPYRVTREVAAITDATDGVDVFDVLERAASNMIHAEDRDSFAEACDPASDDPVTFEDLVALANFLIEQVSGRPPTQPRSSASGQPDPGTSSTDTSSTQLAAV